MMYRFVCTVLLLALACGTAVSNDDAAAMWPEQIEADWRLQEQLRTAEPQVTAEQDAAGACDIVFTAAAHHSIEGGSAHFRIPSGVSVFFQAFDERGMAVQTMRSLTYVLPGQTLSCIGCHFSAEQEE